MGTNAHNSGEVYRSNSVKGFAINHSISTLPEDAGLKFVLKSQGSWFHCGYHLTTSIVGPVLLTLPFSFTLLGWGGGMLWLTLAGLVTFYSYNLLSMVLEHHAQLGHRQLRFRDMARDILGPLQFLICFGTVIGGPLVGGKSLKFIYALYNPDGSMKLYQFIIICGIITLLLAQLPSFHSLRHINLLSLILSVTYSTLVMIGSIYIGHSKNAPPKHYSLQGSHVDQLFGVFNGISIIATAYASGIIPEIQASYWAFGNQANGTILTNFIGETKTLLPKWFFLITNLFILVQVMAMTALKAVKLAYANEIVAESLPATNK
ncbi:hypothetical protein TanjilG_17643 [Lupinus angustifolius]|uniref:Amino acid transporter transmembrane domain-containing protein n=1 Tax=Lupinus angustifolius TaxID=3871 RepID=A0A1J7HK80_LUPAN|nr:hypothetical protein TanjilG_17643 [Lupinus angustifolius]